MSRLLWFLPLLMACQEETSLLDPLCGEGLVELDPASASESYDQLDTWIEVMEAGLSMDLAWEGESPPTDWSQWSFTLLDDPPIVVREGSFVDGEGGCETRRVAHLQALLVTLDSSYGNVVELEVRLDQEETTWSGYIHDYWDQDYVEQAEAVQEWWLSILQENDYHIANLITPPLFWGLSGDQKAGRVDVFVPSWEPQLTPTRLAVGTFTVNASR